MPFTRPEGSRNRPLPGGDADQFAPGLAAQRKAQRIEKNGFPCSGFAGQDVQAGMETPASRASIRTMFRISRLRSIAPLVPSHGPSARRSPFRSRWPLSEPLALDHAAIDPAEETIVVLVVGQQVPAGQQRVAVGVPVRAWVSCGPAPPPRPRPRSPAPAPNSPRPFGAAPRVSGWSSDTCPPQPGND